VLDIEQAWGKHPGWLGTLEDHEQISVWAHHRRKLEDRQKQGGGSG
jgi:hypothetical protein